MVPTVAKGGWLLLPITMFISVGVNTYGHANCKFMSCLASTIPFNFGENLCWGAQFWGSNRRIQTRKQESAWCLLGMRMAAQLLWRQTPAGWSSVAQGMALANMLKLVECFQTNGMKVQESRITSRWIVDGFLPFFTYSLVVLLVFAPI